MGQLNSTEEKIEQLRRLVVVQKKLDDVKRLLIEEKKRFLEQMLELDKQTLSALTPEEKKKLHAQAKKCLDNFKLTVKRLARETQSVYVKIN